MHCSQLRLSSPFGLERRCIAAWLVAVNTEIIHLIVQQTQASYPTRLLLLTESRLTIYDPIEPGSALWLTAVELEETLNQRLPSRSVAGMSLRTRSKAVKVKECEASQNH